MEDFKWQEGTEEIEILRWDYRFQNPISHQTNLYIIYIDNKEIKYISQEGQTLRIDKIKDGKKKPEIMINLEQIENLYWIGNYRNNQTKVGKWIATWKGKLLNSVGGYYSQDGLKEGQWQELFNNYFQSAQVYEQGEYLNDLRRGFWQYKYQDKLIGGGFFTEQGEKNRKWIQLSQKFYNQSQVIYIGEYKNEKKVGIWDIFFDIEGIKKYELVGGGVYDVQGLKGGRWIDLCDHFSKNCQVIYRGEYKNGNKFGQWDTYCRFSWNQPFEKIGGGQYDQSQQREQKNGQWIDYNWENCLITYHGEYNFGQKVGKWDTYYIENLIGGGSYQKEKQLKYGKWIELCEKFYYNSQILYTGEYLNNKKIGKWCSLFCRELIGGGNYDENKGDIKIGEWTDLSEDFGEFNQVIFYGHYKNGKKIGKWLEMFRESGELNAGFIQTGEQYYGD
ncbi:unnamed protein product [Paramecium sonneborni]|uniref:Uncharacterized protein n=1 Tax=Paramecium sonneborni TaxID=65129 RepID=A0A8S1RQN8_9CILI|nr:unnamed protein product [Paramecium sonneborni]